MRGRPVDEMKEFRDPEESSHTHPAHTIGMIMGAEITEKERILYANAKDLFKI